MPNTVALTFDDLGVPEKCPTCGCPVWEYTGAVPEGVHRVYCPSCGRTYVRMDKFENLAYAAGMLADYARRGSRPACLPWYHRVVALMYSLDGAHPDGMEMFCTIEGTPDEDYDGEIPF